MFIEPIASPKALVVIWSGHGFEVDHVDDGWQKCIGQFDCQEGSCCTREKPPVSPRVRIVVASI
jgi:hypothetical protein